ncbi:MAG: glycerol-3-phosphate 1-O-acyltransferase PlsY [Chthoniobacterales bacterium]
MSILATVALISYLLGSFPAGYLAGRIAGVDIRKIGSGNIGATNVLRVLGKQFGYPVFLIDFAKGFAAVLLAMFVARRSAGEATYVEFCAAVGGVCAVLGHSFPVWLRFKGGKGVATSIGVLFGLLPVAALIVCAVWIVTFELSRYVSLASIIAALTLPATVVALRFFGEPTTPVLFYFSLFLAAVVILRHRSNLARLFRGTEPRFRRK